MSIQPSNLDDIKIFSGIDIRGEYADKVFSPEGEVAKQKSLDAAKRELDKIEAFYQKHKEKLNHQTYGGFLRTVKANLSELNKEGEDVRSAVIAKLSELANDRIHQKEAKFSWIHKFFHKIGQLFRGHGFRTKGEWGLELASRIQKPENKANENGAQVLSMELRYHLWFLSSLNEVRCRVNEMSEEEFKKNLNHVIFGHKEHREVKDDTTGFMTLYSGFGSQKLDFYESLSDEKKKIFDQALVERDDWYTQACDIVGENDPDYMPFITEEMVKRFQQNPSHVVDLYKNIKSKDSWDIKFFYALIEATIQNYLYSNSAERYTKIASLLDI